MTMIGRQLFVTQWRGLTDSPDMFGSFPGGCSYLTNVQPDRGIKGAMIARGGHTPLTFLNGLKNPTFISLIGLSGSYLFGMAVSQDYPGYEMPWIYNVDTDAFVSIANISSTNLPLASSPNGPWNPPTYAQVGAYILITHPGATSTNPFFWVDLTTGSPIWNSGNLAINPLPGIPTIVSQYYDRAYFVVENTIHYSDSEAPLQRTLDTQFLTTGDNLPITAMAGLPLGTGEEGVIQSLLAFKPLQIWQITGDDTLGTLALNQLSEATGCQAQNTLVAVPEGLVFLAPDGLRILEVNGNLAFYGAQAQNLITQELAQSDQPNFILAFLNCTIPSRACASYTGNIFRISLPTLYLGKTYPYADFWFDTISRVWVGPHTFSYNGIVESPTGFYVISSGVNGQIFSCPFYPSDTTTYEDNGQTYQVYMKTTWFNLTGSGGNAFAAQQAMLEMGATGIEPSYTVTLTNERGNRIGLASAPTVGQVGVWGAMIWGQFIWGSSEVPLLRKSLNFPGVLVGQSMTALIAQEATSTFIVRSFEMKYRELGYEVPA